jgi:protein O-mannosyl-transferase
MKGRIPPVAIAYAAVALAAIIVYGNAITNGFAYDDLPIIRNNPRVHQLADQAMIWLTPYWPYSGEEYGLYRPVAIFAYALQWRVGGGEAWLFHAVSIAMHAAVSLLVLRLLLYFVPLAAAAVGALVFAVHPVHTEAVANIVGQAELIAAGVTLAACVLHARRGPGPDVSWRLRTAHVLLFVVAVLAKENAIGLPLLLVVIDVAQRRFEWTRKGVLGYVRSMAFLAFLIAAATAAYLLVRADVLGSIRGVDANPSLPYLREEYRILTAMRAWPEFARLTFFPFDLSAEYGPGVIVPMSTVTPMVALGILIFVGTLCCAIAGVRRPLVMLPAAWFLVSILTVSNLLFPVGVLVAERTLYTPSVTAAFVAAAAGGGAGVGVREERAAVLVAFGARTWTRNPDWASTDAVIIAMQRDRPEAYRPYWARASILTFTGDHAQADAYWRLAYHLWPRDATMLVEYAAFLNRTLRYEQALPLLEEAARITPWSVRSHFFLAESYNGLGRHRDAVVALQDAIRTGFVEPRMYFAQLARAYEGLGDHRFSLGAWRAAVSSERGEHWLLLSFLARSAPRYGAAEEATLAAERAIERTGSISPDVPDELRRLAVTTATAVRQEIVRGCHAATPAEACSDVLADWLHFGESLPRHPAKELQSAMSAPLSADAAAAKSGT